jgi:hypothetical protein
MQTNLITSNIIDRIYKNINKYPANIIYLDNGSLFDRVFTESLPHNVFVHKSIPDVDFNLTTYDLCISSDPIYYSQNQSVINALQIPAMILVHNNPISTIKKEDKFLVGKYLNNTKKIFFDIDIANNWAIGYDAIVEYGFPDISTETINDKKSSVIVLNTNNSKQIKILHQVIKTKYNDCSMISYADFSNTDDIIKEISKYKIAVSIQNTYDSIMCDLAGCYTITTQPSKYVDFSIVSDFNKIDSIISEQLTTERQRKYNIFRNTKDMILDINNIIHNHRLS